MYTVSNTGTKSKFLNICLWFGFMVLRGCASLERACISFINDPQIVPMGFKRRSKTSITYTQFMKIFGMDRALVAGYVCCFTVYYYAISYLKAIEKEGNWKFCVQFIRLEGWTGPSYLKFIIFCMVAIKKRKSIGKSVLFFEKCYTGNTYY